MRSWKQLPAYWPGLAWTILRLFLSRGNSASPSVLFITIFPNKFAILYAVGERWLEEMTTVLETVESWDLDQTGIDGFVDQYCDEMLKTYRLQIAVLPLVQAMVTMPELRKLDQLHDKEIISCLMKVCRRLGIRKKDDELNRIGCLVLEISHTLFMVIVGQNEQRGSKTLSDLKGILKEYMRWQMT